MEVTILLIRQNGLWTSFTHTGTCLPWLLLLPLKVLLQCPKSGASGATESFLCSAMWVIREGRFLQVILNLLGSHCAKDPTLFTHSNLELLGCSSYAYNLYYLANLNPCWTVPIVHVGRKDLPLLGLCFCLKCRWQGGSQDRILILSPLRTHRVLLGALSNWEQGDIFFSYNSLKFYYSVFLVLREFQWFFSQLFRKPKSKEKEFVGVILWLSL